jgi:hypothetical protein
LENRGEATCFTKGTLDVNLISWWELDPAGAKVLVRAEPAGKGYGHRSELYLTSPFELRRERRTLKNFNEGS